MSSPILAAEVPPLPDREGFAGSFAGVSHGNLIVAGGANFPGKKPWEGGTKAWYDHVYLLRPNEAEWKNVGKLPRAMGYGVGVTHRDALILIGGADAGQHFAEVYRMEWINGDLNFRELPKLPKALAYACGAMHGETVYVAGGLEKPEAASTSNEVYRMDLSAKTPQWERLEGCPKPGRMLSVASVADGRFWMFSGVDLSPGKDGKPVRNYLKDAYSYSPLRGWKKECDLPVPVAAAPSPAPAGNGAIFILGGDDGTQLGTAPEKHKGFSTAILQYDVLRQQWIEAGKVAQGNVTTPCTRWAEEWLVPGGEVRPGVRSPRIVRFSESR
jgi:N-acetylneuraminic acid mutarotase